MTGLDDGADLYAEDNGPCLVCGRIVGTDFDGLTTWHIKPLPTDAHWLPIRPFGDWCSGSRKSWAVPA